MAEDDVIADTAAAGFSKVVWGSMRISPYLLILCLGGGYSKLFLVFEWTLFYI